MKAFYIPAGLLIFILGFSLWAGRYVELRTEHWAAQLEAADAAGRQENWEEAAHLTHQARDRWMDHDRYLHITLRHTDTDAIQISMDEALAFLEGGEKQPAEYAAVNARLLTQLGLLVEAELPTLTNVL